MKDRWQGLVGWPGLQIWGVVIGSPGPLKHRPLTYQTPAQLRVRKDILDDPAKKSIASNLSVRVIFGLFFSMHVAYIKHVLVIHQI